MKNYNWRFQFDTDNINWNWILKDLIIQIVLYFAFKYLAAGLSLNWSVDSYLMGWVAYHIITFVHPTSE
jgi:hypothetical protein